MKRESIRLAGLIRELRAHQGRYEEDHYPAIMAGLQEAIDEAEHLRAAADAFEEWAKLPQPIPAPRWDQLVRDRGAVGAARYVLRRGANLDTFYDLLTIGRADATVEDNARRPEFAVLFTEDELIEARRRLADGPLR